LRKGELVPIIANALICAPHVEELVGNPNQICKNCHNPKSRHHYKDAFCLLTMKWKPEEFKHLGTDEEFVEYLKKLPK
jgi:hypothetical protein